MDRSQTRMLVVMSALLAGLAVGLYLGKDSPPEADAEATAKIWEVDPSTAVRVSIERSSGVLELERRGEEWFVVSPADRADRDQVNDLLDTLKAAKMGIPVEGWEDHPGDFGLGDPPMARVRLTQGDGTEAILDVGVEAPIGFRTYARTAEGGIAAVNGDLNRPLQADASRYREHRVLRFDPGAVRDVRIAGPQGTLHVHGESKDWFVEGYGRADADKVDDLVVGLLDLRYDTVDTELLVRPTPSVQPPEGGAPSAAFDVRVTTDDGAAVGFSTGDQTAEGVALTATDGRRGRVWPEALKQLGRGPGDVAVELVFGIAIDETDSVRIRAGERSLEARRDGAAWHVDGGDDASTYAWIQALSRTRSQLRPEAPETSGAVALTVEVVEGDRSWTLEVGAPGTDGYRAARDTAADAAVRIPAESVDEALAALAAPQP